MRLHEYLDTISGNELLWIRNDVLGNTLVEFVPGQNEIPACLIDCEVTGVEPGAVTIDATDTLFEIATEHVKNMSDEEVEEYAYNVWCFYNEGVADEDQWMVPVGRDDRTFLLDWIDIDPEMAIRLLDINLFEKSPSLETHQLQNTVGNVPQPEKVEEGRTNTTEEDRRAKERQLRLQLEDKLQQELDDYLLKVRALGVNFAIDSASEIAVKKLLGDSAWYDLYFSERELNALLSCEKPLQKMYDDWQTRESILQSEVHSSMLRSLSALVDTNSKGAAKVQEKER